jgi:site-specific DNA-methyltransferase (adenine-specific)
MTTQSSFVLRGRNPDILTCIANLSSDEVFTPPELATRMLTTLAEAWAANNDGANIWTDQAVTFLDPCTKSGVFLREITSRLIEGLQDAIPDLQERVNHILTRQVFGIGITQITSLLARRSVYCSKSANGEHSIATAFADEAGNIWFDRTEHNWEGSKCRYCTAPKAILDRDTDIENYAYPFIHTGDIGTWVRERFGENMQFDVVIGNPPYQMKGGAGGSSDSSIYQLFVEQAMMLEPRFLSMVIPARWMAGGRGLDEFRSQLLSGGQVRELVDFQNSGDAFPGVQIKGGVCYFLWDSSHNGSCNVTRVLNDSDYRQSSRQLNEFDVFVRDERALGILKKVLAANTKSVVEIVSGDTPFGIATNFEDWTKRETSGSVTLHLIERGKRIVGWVKRARISKNTDLIDNWKVLVPEAYGAGEGFPHQILGKEIVVGAPSVCTQSYLVVGPFATKKAASSFSTYYRTRLFRFLVSLRKISQHALRSTYTWVPQQTWDREWKDEDLYKKYKLTKDEIAFIESLIRPMDKTGE